MNKNKFKNAIELLPFITIATILLTLGIVVGVNNLEFQAENGFTPMTIDLPLWIQYICYWIVMMAGWVLAIPFLWIIIGPKNYNEK